MKKEKVHFTRNSCENLAAVLERDPHEPVNRSEHLVLNGGRSQKILVFFFGA